MILLVASYAGRWTWACFVAACAMLLFLHVDCFRDRQWVGLNVQPSLWTQSMAKKPAALRSLATAAARIASGGRRVLIANTWPWGLAWQKAHANWPGVLVPKNGAQMFDQAYTVGPGIVASRAILDSGLGNDGSELRKYSRDGYAIWIDNHLYRELFRRYDPTSPTPEAAQVEGVFCRIVEVE